MPRRSPLRSKAISGGLLLPYWSVSKNVLSLEVSTSETPWPFRLFGSHLLPTLGRVSTLCWRERLGSAVTGTGAPGTGAVTVPPALTSTRPEGPALGTVGRADPLPALAAVRGPSASGGLVTQTPFPWEWQGHSDSCP